MRILAFAGGLAGAVALSQFPEFSQQYLQRLSGAVDELEAVTIVFDNAAEAAGLTREEALIQMRAGESDLVASVGSGLADQITRFERLNADYQVLASATPLMRLANIWRLRDPELVARTWSHYQPAVPVTVDGFVTGGIGFVIGWAFIGGLLSLLKRPFRRRRRDRRTPNDLSFLDIPPPPPPEPLRQATEASGTERPAPRDPAIHAPDISARASERQVPPPPGEPGSTPVRVGPHDGSDTPKRQALQKRRLFVERVSGGRSDQPADMETRGPDDSFAKRLDRERNRRSRNGTTDSDGE